MHIVPRHLHGLIRLTFAHAKLHFKEIADVKDAQAACTIMQKSLESLNVNTSNPKNDTFWDSKQISKMETVWKTFDKVKDEDNAIEITEFTTELAKTPFFTDYYAQTFTENNLIDGENQQFQKLANGRYRRIK